MGIIKRGTISGNLPTTEAFAVHYPAYPSSLDRAVETLGGTGAIAKARSSESKLELHFRPEDPYSHPAFGERHACNHFLLRISKNRVSNLQDSELRNNVLSFPAADFVTVEQKKSSSELIESTQPINGPESENVAPSAEAEAQILEEGQEHLSAELVTCIQEAYHFNGMVDYQHVLAVHADVARRKKRSWAEFEKGGLMDQEDLMILVPPLFSLKDMPEKVVLKPCGDISLKRKQEGVVQHHWEIPRKVNWETYIPENSEQWVQQKIVCELFDERPIWVKDSLSERLLDKGLECRGNTLRRLLFRVAYYFKNGPFLRFWIRKGYDPRKDPESCIYQRTDFRVPPSLRSYCDTNAASGLKHRWEDICAFRVFPYKCQTSLQLFELADDYIQEEIRKPSKIETCSYTTGWFSSNVLDSLRKRVAVRFLSVSPSASAKALLKSASDSFEKSKKICMYPENLKVNEERQQANGEVVENQEKDSTDEEDEEENDIEDDIAEEDLDAYEAVDPIGIPEGNFSPQLSPYIDHENMSTNYLQELFGSFPFNAAGGNEMPDANTSDGEYEIYEQYSDGNYSDDDE
ncbi:hypothetical protein ACH5RR_007066 [Cinchona calisaya]|uniref:General transcription factor 3C polypeptide 5-like n=1 Tax=Cinchona calisaya TaxID=153742 RepID=A0ABD3AQU6_9GENT